MRQDLGNEIENRVNQTKNILHKCALEGKIDIGLMLRDFDYLINENKELKEIYGLLLILMK